MTWPEIIAHRGATGAQAPDNTLAAFERAIALGADVIELDVRLTRDQAPVVFHNVYLDDLTPHTGPVFEHLAADILGCPVFPRKRSDVYPPTSTLRESPAASGHAVSGRAPIPGAYLAHLDEVLETLAGRIRLEVEIKGPEPEAAEIVATALRRQPRCLEGLEVTSYEPLLLHLVRERLPGVSTDVLLPLPEPWMGPEVWSYQAAHRARIAGARAVHLHATQLTPTAVQVIHAYGVEVHAWGINTPEYFSLAMDLDTPRLCTDHADLILSLRNSISK